MKKGNKKDANFHELREFRIRDNLPACLPAGL
ncbi:MAG: hypothetical protein ACI8P3_004263 [Saprospiraceae bacterium]|jgi:hypothetical protein